MLRERSRPLGALLVLGALAGAGGGATLAAFVATTANGSNQIESGTVAIGDNDDGSTTLSFSNAIPGATDSSCIKVTSSGSLASSVRLYGTTTGSGLDPYLNLKVTRGAFTPTEPAFDSCTNFQADLTNYIGAGNGVVYDGTLQGFPDSYGAGLVDPTSGSPENWSSGEAHVYRLDVTLASNFAGQNTTASQTFVWEARNL